RTSAPIRHAWRSRAASTCSSALDLDSSTQHHLDARSRLAQRHTVLVDHAALATPPGSVHEPQVVAASLGNTLNLHRRDEQTLLVELRAPAHVGTHEQPRVR